MRLKNGRATEWWIVKRGMGGKVDFWEDCRSLPAAKRKMRSSYDGGDFDIVKVSYSRVASPKRSTAK